MNNIRINTIITAATPALTLMLKIKHTQFHHDVAKLRNQFIYEIKLFERLLQKNTVNNHSILAARYCLCTAIDEAILNSPWGTQSVWVQQGLLSLFHQETWGGERFYKILDDAIKEPRQNIALIEFMYLLLSLGFEGRFFDADKVIREEIRSRIFQRIRQARGKVTRMLSDCWKDEHPLKSSNRQKSSLKLLLISAATLMGFTALLFNIKAYSLSATTINDLKQIGMVSPVTTYSQLIDRPIISHTMD